MQWSRLSVISRCFLLSRPPASWKPSRVRRPSAGTRDGGQRSERTLIGGARPRCQQPREQGRPLEAASSGLFCASITGADFRAPVSLASFERSGAARLRSALHELRACLILCVCERPAPEEVADADVGNIFKDIFLTIYQRWPGLSGRVLDDRVLGETEQTLGRADDERQRTHPTRTSIRGSEGRGKGLQTGRGRAKEL